jgi:hypothetical protein
MLIRTKYPLLVSAMALVLLLVCACNPLPGVAKSSSGGGSSSTGSSSLTPLQVLKNSSTAMKQLKSFHIAVQSTDNITSSGSAQTLPASAATPVSTMTPSNFNLSTSVSGSGDEAPPNQEQFQLSINTMNMNTSMAEIVLGDKVYVQNSQKKWYLLDKSTFQGMGSNPFSSLTMDQNSLLALVMDTKITDHGDENLNGQSLRHITAVLDKDALRQLLTSNPQLQGAQMQQALNKSMAQMKSFSGSLDVWIDETNFYVHRTQIKISISMDSATAAGGASGGAATVSMNLNSTIDMSKFNVPVTITPPTNATPTDNPGVLFGLGNA